MMGLKRRMFFGGVVASSMLVSPTWATAEAATRGSARRAARVRRAKRAARRRRRSRIVDEHPGLGHCSRHAHNIIALIRESASAATRAVAGHGKSLALAPVYSPR